jgi:hypothetical protein
VTGKPKQLVRVGCRTGGCREPEAALRTGFGGAGGADGGGGRAGLARQATGRGALSPTGRRTWTRLPRLPKPLRQRIGRRRAGRWAGRGSRRSFESVDGTERYLVERATICVSSQVGCAVNCQFCLTAKLGMQRNLTAGEIAGQVAAVLKREAGRGGGGIGSTWCLWGWASRS